jgi:ribosomal-protein-alanine N-acetyltransferase
VSAAYRPEEPRLLPMTTGWLDAVMKIENEVYEFPWSRGNFVDSIAAGYHALLLCGAGKELLGYCVAMSGVDELHLLNITVAASQRRRGHARRMLDELQALGRRLGLRQLWLEVRESNAPALATYHRLGFATIGRRAGYYPAAHGRRENAIVMSLPIDAPGKAGDALD